MKRVAERGGFRGQTTVIDFGPQDIQVSRPILEKLAHGLNPPEKARALLDSMLDGETVRRTAQKDFYTIFGLAEYSSLDSEDDRATYKVDLNHPAPQLPEFGIVTNFGTTEHVFNIGEAFKTIHNATRPGGISMHAIPSFAFINHGFYNIHPNAMVEMVRANKYEIVDFSYVDNTFCRNQYLSRAGIEAIDFDALPIQLSDMESTQTFMPKVVEVFYKNLMAPETQAAITEQGTLPGAGEVAPYPNRRYQISYVFDLLFIAMRRPSERLPFVMPMQDMAGVPPLETVSRGGSWLSRIKAGLGIA